MVLDDVFISGFSGRFPNCPDVPSLFDKLLNGLDCVDVSKRYPEGYLGLPSRAGHLVEIDKFDSLFFKMNKAHVEGMDIQIRNLLEVVYEALVDSNLSIQAVKGSNTGVYVGNCFSDYHNGILQNINDVNGYENLGSAISMSANKISYFFDLTGPSIAVDTACSSSLYALSLAISDLESGKIERAIVAGVSLNLRPVVSKVFQKYNMLSPTGTCYSFDDRADGYCRSESINAVILQRGSGYAKIIGHGVNANGSTEQGITFPNVYKQAELFSHVCEKYQIDKSKIEYIEAHGTGTTAGDNVEITALDTVY
jgi:fatty acid synthase